MDDVFAQVVDEARRRQRGADVDLAPAVDHLTTTLPAVVADWDLTIDGWFGHSILPTLSVRLSDGTPGVLKMRLPGELDREARVMAAGPAAYATVLAYDGQRGVLVTERASASACSPRTRT
ncbi:hypothetical protein L2K70_06070 [Nocardioides KLBMP 9356]|uniref:Aminoglycoside phosphotransferase domain-containing protein n=1 Tax=Nocardioides potassii TaxID=2911371 RepID=A0ABS9HA92_9ACTN|nr:hypothetical protein [Nocardioides potassii]MCF6377161.1 hypothetical protein [Nocardioides potassii]